MKKIYFIAAMLLVSLGAASVHAESYKVGAVNVSRVLKSAPQTKAAGEALEKEFASRDRELVEMQKDVRKVEDKIIRDGAIMADGERTKIERDLRAKKRDLKRLQDEFREDVNLRRNQEQASIMRKILETIKAIAEEGKYDIILNEGSVVHISDRVNLTDKVIKRLEKGFKK